MNHDTWRRLEALVDEALDLDEAGRAALLERIGAEDPERREELARFLAQEVAARTFLSDPAIDPAARLLATMGDESWDALELEGADIGPYRVVRELGRGGMGAVFLARRADGQFEQDVALKLVRRGMDSADVLARFRMERQILARLAHPHIARLLDGGAAESGQPYFAMEHVEGRPITEYAGALRLSTDARLVLLLQVCDAVEYAHRSLVVHRDLKPSNILVTVNGQAKLLDFGIAKVLDPADTTPGLTRQDARLLTPRYAAPEQLRGEPVTTATDVYSLGVVFYEVLVGRYPYAKAETLGIERAVLEEDAGPLPAPIDRDLDSIVRKALQKEPERRYPSVAALAEDLRRWQAGLPVSARPDRVSYRAAKFVARHRLAVGSAALVSMALLAGGLGTYWQARRALQQARRADEVQRFTLSLFEVADPNTAKGREITARELLTRGAARIETELAGQPEVQAEMLLVIGRIQHQLGLDRESRPLLERAYQLKRDRLGREALEVADVESALGSALLADGLTDEARRLFEGVLASRRRVLGADHPDTARASYQLGRLHLEAGRLAESSAALVESLSVLRRHLPAARADLAGALNVLGRVRQAQGEWREAEAAYREALEIWASIFSGEHTLVAEGHMNLGTVLQEKGDLPGAIAEYERALAIDRRLLGGDHETVADVLNNLGTAQIAAGRLEEAEAALQESLAIRERAHGADSPPTAVAVHNLSRALRARGRLGEAERRSRQALRLAVSRLGEDHVNVAFVRDELARILADAGRWSEAAPIAHQAVTVLERGLPAAHPRLAEARRTLEEIAAGQRGAATRQE